MNNVDDEQISFFLTDLHFKFEILHFFPINREFITANDKSVLSKNGSIS